jgi:hypothetical protein
MTKINIRHTFNRIRIHSKKDENLTTFKIKYAIYKYLIMFFELTNESFIFQNFMNDTFINYLNEFVIAYLDDIIVYSNNKKKTYTARAKNSSSIARDKHSSRCR